MKLPDIISHLLHAQKNFDSEAYANCFSTNAIVQDEGKTYKGREEIRQWNEETNNKYNMHIKVLDLYNDADNMTLSVAVSGTFPGSPIELKYHFEIEDGYIVHLKIN
ncbi:hypothetical protein GCM10007424_25870 [Flavobacterium suaedae]|uniref:SnoaL-like domain-containing protein n=1 Tax=Flavobacterium suaedae TaxID=1767027 RepID=A0ABQ1K2K2_9FLAO|nr:nuclear transport factor 2 family protein [Flavobacterium suaedae]GGB84651.1 hypothetical protein GCM10007424_25870 [Flavobacterium suaedae]